jgi:hypothetical protein
MAQRAMGSAGGSTAADAPSQQSTKKRQRWTKTKLTSSAQKKPKLSGQKTALSQQTEECAAGQRRSPRLNYSGTGGDATSSADGEEVDCPPRRLFRISNVAHGPSALLSCAVRRAFDGSNVHHVYISCVPAGSVQPDCTVWELLPIPKKRRTPEAESQKVTFIRHQRFGRLLDSHGRDVWLLGDGVDARAAGLSIKWRLEAVTGVGRIANRQLLCACAVHALCMRLDGIRYMYTPPRGVDRHTVRGQVPQHRTPTPYFTSGVASDSTRLASRRRKTAAWMGLCAYGSQIANAAPGRQGVVTTTTRLPRRRSHSLRSGFSTLSDRALVCTSVWCVLRMDRHPPCNPMYCTQIRPSQAPPSHRAATPPSPSAR